MKKVCVPAEDCFGDGQSCKGPADCCSGICDDDICLPSNMLSCGRPGMKCRAASDCCGVDSQCELDPQTSFRFCKPPQGGGYGAGGGSGKPNINFGLCKGDSDCKTWQTCNTRNGKCIANNKNNNDDDGAANWLDMLFNY